MRGPLESGKWCHSVFSVTFRLSTYIVLCSNGPFLVAEVPHQSCNVVSQTCMGGIDLPVKQRAPLRFVRGFFTISTCSMAAEKHPSKTLQGQAYIGFYLQRRLAPYNKMLSMCQFQVQTHNEVQAVHSTFILNVFQSQE